MKVKPLHVHQRSVVSVAFASRNGNIRTGSVPVIPPPKPQPQPFSDEAGLHGDPPREDPFRWLHSGLRDPRVLQYLKQENDYAKLQLNRLQPLRKQLENEIAELSWQQALALAAQQAEKAAAGSSPRYGDFLHRREQVVGPRTGYRHLRIPVTQASTTSPLGVPPTLPGSSNQQSDSIQQADHQFHLAPAVDQINLVDHDGARIVLDEAQRAATASDSSVHAIRFVAPSPAFDLLAFTETSEKVPLGQRRPDRFVLYVQDVHDGRPVLPPIPEVSGDVGWVACAPQFTGLRANLDGGSLSSGEDDGAEGSRDPRLGRQGSGVRLYFTRRAQRELWCLDFPPPPQPPQAPAPPLAPQSAVVALSAQWTAAGCGLHAQGAAGTSPLSSEATACSASGSPANTARGTARQKLVLRDPDGQPIQLVQYGDHLYAKTLGNDGTALEIRLLGLAAAPQAGAAAAAVGTALAARPATQPCDADGSEGPFGCADVRGDRRGDGGGCSARPPEEGSPGPLSDAGVVLVPRAPGRRYRILPFRSSTRTGSGRPAGAVDGPSSGSGSACGGEGGDRMLSACSPMLLWVHDLEHPCGCLRMVLVGQPDGAPAELGGSCVQVLEQDVLPHDPALRIVHVDAVRPGTVLCVRAAVDARGDPAGRYDILELQVDWEAVRQSAVQYGQGRDRNAAAVLEPAAAAAAGGTHSDGGADCRDGWVQGAGVSPLASRGVKDSSRIGLPRIAATVRQRDVSVLNGRPHAMRVLGWDEVGGSVDVSYSSLGVPPAAARVQLLSKPPPGPTTSATIRSPADPDSGPNSSGEGLPGSPDNCDCGDMRAGEGSAPVLELGAGSEPRVVTERLWATAEDGALVPITLCRSAGGPAGEREGREVGPVKQISGPRPPAPLLLRVYGAYGSDPSLEYQAWVPPLLRRGVAVAVAHVRGGGQLGPAWYEGGRGLRKATSGRDLVAAARHLVQTGVTSPELLCLEAESAGGWAAGPALSAAGRSLFRAAVLTVPTLDPLTSLLVDETYGPYELGDPRVDPALYRAVLEWSPYDQLLGSGRATDCTSGAVAGGFPSLLLRVGLYDTNVPYWDPSKYMARLRNEVKARQDALQCMQVKPGGHDVYDNISDDAMRCAFMLWAVGAWKA